MNWNSEELFAMEKEALTYIATEGSQVIKAQAVLVNDMVLKAASRLFQKMDKPNYPHKTFYDKNEAISWLQQFLD